MKKQNIYHNYYTPIQMRIPVDLEKIIEISDPIYTFNEIMDLIDPEKYYEKLEDYVNKLKKYADF